MPDTTSGDVLNWRIQISWFGGGAALLNMLASAHLKLINIDFYGKYQLGWPNDIFVIDVAASQEQINLFRASLYRDDIGRMFIQEMDKP